MHDDDSRMVGRTFQARTPFVVTAERIADFCAAIGESNPLYSDPVAAKAGPYGGIIAPPGFLASFRYADDVFDQIPAFARGGHREVSRYSERAWRHRHDSQDARR